MTRFELHADGTFDVSNRSELELKRDDGTWILASINWSQRTRATEIELPGNEKFRVYDFWSKKDLGIKRGRVKIPKHALHQTIVLHCIPLTRKTTPRFQHVAFF